MVLGNNSRIPLYQTNWYAGNPNGYQSQFAGIKGLKDLAEIDQQLGILSAPGQANAAASGTAATGATEGANTTKGIDPLAIGTVAAGLVGDTMSSLAEDSIRQNNPDNPYYQNLFGNNTWGNIFNGDVELDAALKSINSGIGDFSGIKNNTNLRNAWDENAFQKEAVGTTSGQKAASSIGETLSDTATGAGLGTMIMPGLGTAIGAGLGALAGGIKSWLNFGDEDDELEKVNKAVRRANKMTTESFYNTAKQNTTRMNREAFMHQFAGGGSLEDLNGVTEFNVGGSHSENPYEGIQQGIAPDGNPNLVEEGEVKYKDYIYSARLKPSKSMLKEYNLPEKYAGKTFAELADVLQKESSERPNDPISRTTLDEWMSRLASAQEEYKAKQAERKLVKALDSMSDEEKAATMSSLVQPMAQEGVDLGQPMYANGGGIHIKKENRGKFTSSAKRAGMGVQEFARHVLANKDKYSSTQVKRANFARNAAKWHADGGHLFPDGGYPWQVGYLYDNGILKQDRPITSIPLVPYQTRVLYDPLLERNSGKELPVIDITAKKTEVPVEYMPAMVQPEFKPEFAELSYDPSGLAAAIEAINESEPVTTKDTDNTKNKSKRFKFNFNPENLRYAPAVGAGLSALTAALQSKDYTLANQYRNIASQYKPIAAPHIGGYRRYTPYDINLGDAENIALTASALTANRGQNRATQGALNTAVINAAQKTAAQRNLAAQQANEANRLAVDTYNLGIDQFNAQRDTQYDQLNQQILQNKLNTLMAAARAEDASKEAWAGMYNTTHENFFNQLGNVGQDIWNRNQRDWLLNSLGREGILELLKAGYKLG